jgi:MFS family permease
METHVNIIPQETSEAATGPEVQERKNGGLSKGLLLLLFFLAAVNWASIFDRVMSADEQQDFSIFYTGGRILWSGHAAQLYDLPTQARYQTAHYQLQPLPFDHPAYEVLLFLPLISLPFNVAIALWGIAGFAMSWAIARLLAPQLADLPGPASLWIFAMAVASFPLVWTLAQGQDSILLLALFVLVYVNLKSRRDMIAGVSLAAALFKFTLVLPFVIPFLLFRRWKFLAGFAGGGLVVTSISVAMTGIQGARQYVHLLLDLFAHPELGYINPMVMPNVRGFLSAVLEGSSLSRTTFNVVVGGCALLLLLIPLLTFDDGERRSERFDLWFGLNLTVALLASPHLLWHDLAVLLLPVLLAVNVLLKPPDGRISWRAILWGLAYGCACPVYFVFSPSYYFPVWCVLIFWFVRKIVTIGHDRLNVEAFSDAVPTS